MSRAAVPESRGLVPQALWRGYSCRKKNDCARIRAVRRSLRTVNAEVREEDRLSRRAARALHCLLTFRHLSAILEALRHLGQSPCPRRARGGGGGRRQVRVQGPALSALGAALFAGARVVAGS